MAKFVYRLQNVLDLKLKLENQQKTNFSMAAAKINSEETKLTKLKKVLETYEQEYREKSIGHINVSELKFSRDSMEYAKEQIKLQEKNVDNAKKQLEIARFALNEAIKERKIFEKLREKALEEYRLEENSAELKEVDQLVSFTYNDNKAGE